MGEENKKNLVWVDNRCLVIHDNTTWIKFKDKGLDKAFHRGITKKEDGKTVPLLTILDFLKITGELTEENYIGSKTYITLSSLKRKIDKKIDELCKKEFKGDKSKLDPMVLKEKVTNRFLERKIFNINTKLKKICPGQSFFDKADQGYELNIFSIDPPNVDGAKKISLVPDKDRLDKLIKAMERHSDDMQKATTKRICHIQPLEQFLQKDVVNDPKIFREIGPLWTDFQAELVFKRSEVADICKGYFDLQLQFLIGYPASGKTVIARTVGYIAATQRWHVYVLSSKSIRIDLTDVLIREIDDIENQPTGSLIILEDIHEIPRDDAGYVIERIFKRSYKKIKFLLTSREPLKNISKIDQTRIFEQCKKITLERKDFWEVSQKIILWYFVKIKEKWISTLKNYHIINFKKIAGGDFWILAILLQGWTPNLSLSESINYELVYDWIKNKLENLEDEFISKYGLENVIETLLIISSLSRRDIPTPKYILEDNPIISIKVKVLSTLVERGEIEYENGDYSIPHRSLANLYIQTSLYKKGEKDYRYLAEKIVQRLDKAGYSKETKFYPVELIRLYLESGPTNIAEIIYALGFNEGYIPISEGYRPKFDYQDDYKQVVISRKNFDENENKPENYLINYLLRRDSTLEVLQDTIKQNNSLPDIGLILMGVGLSSGRSFIPQIIKEINPNNLLERIRTDEEVENIITCLSGLIADEKGDLSNFIMKNLDVSSFRDKIKKFDFKTVSYSICPFLLIDKNTIFKFEGLLTKKVIEDNLWGITVGFDLLKAVERKTSLKILKKVKDILTPEILISKIENENSLHVINACMGHIASIITSDRKNTKKLAGVLLPKINDPNSQPETIISLLLKMAIENENGKKIVNYILDSINITQFQAKLSQYKDSLTLGIVCSKIFPYIKTYAKHDDIILPILKKLNCEHLRWFNSNIFTMFELLDFPRKLLHQDSYYDVFLLMEYSQ